jgi:ABC-2 type transport system ATP-binding protein
MTTGPDPAAGEWHDPSPSALGTTVVLATHFMDEAERLCDRLAIMKAGNIIATDSPQGLIATYATQVRVRFGWRGEESSTLLHRLRRLPHVDDADLVGSRIEVTGTGPVVALVAAEFGGATSGPPGGAAQSGGRVPEAHRTYCRGRGDGVAACAVLPR